jgi:PAS domain S-box-containing protein
MRSELLVQGRLVAEIVGSNEVLSLTGTSADLESSAYRNLKAQLSIVRHVNPAIRFLYLTGLKRDGSVFFFVDSESPDSEDYSAPGQIYEEASEAFKASFRSIEGVVEGPVPDRWGTWVSALVPTMSPLSAQPVAVLGMDVDAKNWTYSILMQCLPLAALTLLFSTVSVFYYFLFRNSEMARRQIAHSRNQLSESEERYRIAANNTGQLVYDVHLASGKIDWSGAIEAVTGYTAEEFATVGSKGWMDLIHPDDRDHALKLRDQAISTGGPYIADYRFRKKDGSFVEIAERGSFSTDPSDPEVHLIGVMEDVSRKREAERELIESQRMISTLMGNLPGMAYRCREDQFWTMEFVSQGCMGLTGYSPEQLISNEVVSYDDIIHPEDRERVRLQVNQALDKGLPFNMTYRIRCAGGEEKWVWEKGQGIFSGNGKLLTLEGIVIDVTEKQRAEAALKESEANYRRIVETAKEGIWITDADFLTRFVNPFMAHILGYRANEMIGRPLHDFMCEEDLPDLKRKMESRRKGISEVYERRYRRKDGAICWMLVSAAPLADTEGKFSGSLGMMTDITERMAADKALRNSEFRFHSLIDSSPDVVILLDLDGYITDTNRSLYAVTGYEQNEFVGCHFKQLLPDQYHQDAYRAINSLKEGIRRDEVFEIEFPRKDGAIASLRVRGWIVTDEDDQPLAIGAFIRDVTDEKKLADERQTLQNQLQQAQKMEAIGALAGGIAHDFNNILSVIMGNAEILEYSGSLDPSSKECIDSILSASRRAKKLVAQILAFSRRGQHDKILLNLNNVGRETLGFLRASLPSNIELKHFFDPGIGTVLADPTQLQQVLMNLCTNAMHAMGDESGVLKIELANAHLSEKDIRFDPEAEPGDYVELTVSDTGHGMDQLTLERIFEPYFTTKPEGKGTGLGLATVHGIVKSHGGIIRVESQPGRGTVFHVFLPRAEGVHSPVPVPSQPMPTGSGRILFVDDEPAIAELGLQALSRLGYRVDTRTSPIEALEAFRKNLGKYDLVITDLAMPQMPGLKLARKLIELQPDLPVIVCTGFSDDFRKESAHSIGVREVLFKPLAIRDLAEAVQKIVIEKNQGPPIFASSRAMAS